MGSYIVKRIAYMLIVILLVSFFSFSLIHIVPGDPVSIILGDMATPERTLRLREQLRLDKPFTLQFMLWFEGLVRGDLGRSIYTQQSVSAMLIRAFAVTFTIATIALGIAAGIGIPFGIVAALHHGSWLDRGLMILAALGISIPAFWLGMNLVLVFSVNLQWFPSGGYVPVSKGLLASLRSTFLASLTLGLGAAAFISRLTRSSMLDVLDQDYTRTAWSKGLSPHTVVLKHVLKNALVPITTILGLTYGILLGGALVTEKVFSMPGIGRLTLSAISQRDYPILQGVLIFIGATYALVNLITDMLYSVIDPRIRYV